jgi:hypothetical protein
MTGQHDFVIERIPWALLGWHEMEVRRSADWWTALQPRLEAFWTDVEKATQGGFVVPESSRKKKDAAAEVPEDSDAVCLIQVPGAAVSE